MDLDAYVSEHGAEWNRLRYLLGRPKRRLSPQEVDELVMLYRRAATHLSVVRSRSGDPTLVAWLSRLVLQARSAVSPSAGFSLAAVQRFFLVTFPVTVFRMGFWCLGAALGFLALATVIGVIVINDPSIAVSLIGEERIEEYVSNDFEAYYSANPPQSFASLVWLNNTLVSALCLAGGVLVAPTLLVLWVNAMNLGLVGGIMVGHGRADVFFGLITVHGLLEFTCIFIAAGAGLRVGWSWIAPGRSLTRVQALARAGRQATVVALGLGVALLVSGLIEAFVTPSFLPIPIRLYIGAVVWLAFLGYVIFFGLAGVRRGETGDVAAYEREAIAPTT
ncbi:MAG: stage II sporulation protein M [Micromonosporaceae bacterium]|nr:stage II sporulation protein M [Micromonosporaceae bacterium]